MRSSKNGNGNIVRERIDECRKNAERINSKVQSSNPSPPPRQHTFPQAWQWCFQMVIPKVRRQSGHVATGFLAGHRSGAGPFPRGGILDSVEEGGGRILNSEKGGSRLLAASGVGGSEILATGRVGRFGNFSSKEEQQGIGCKSHPYPFSWTHTLPPATGKLTAANSYSKGENFSRGQHEECCRLTNGDSLARG